MKSASYIALAVSFIVTAACSGGENACENVVPRALQTCLIDSAAAQRACYQQNGTMCDDSDAALSAAMDNLTSTIEGACDDDEWKSLSVDDLSARIASACTAESNSLSWRAFGGPHGSVYGDALPEEKLCMELAHEVGVTAMDTQMSAIYECKRGKQCDTEQVTSDRNAAVESARQTLDAACPNLAKTIAVSPKIFAERTHQQVDCGALWPTKTQMNWT